MLVHRKVTQQGRLGKSDWTHGQKSTRECSQKEDMVNWLDDAEKPSETCAGFDKVEDTAVRKVFLGMEARMRG